METHEVLIDNAKPIIVNKLDYKFNTTPFLPQNPERKSEGGLRKKGYFKYSYKLINPTKQSKFIKSKSFNIDQTLWYICDTEGNPVRPANSQVQKEINDYLRYLNEKNLYTQENKTIKEIGQVNKLPLITIITVVLNGEKYLEQTILSVINQTYPNLEYIIIDGGSTDKTLDIIRKYDDYIDYWVSEPDEGIYHAMNKGIICSLGEWIGFIGSDDFYENDSIENLIYFYLKDENSDVYYGNSNVFIDNKFLFTRIVSPEPGDLMKNFIFFHPDSIAKAQIYKLIGTYDTSLKLASDYEFFLRALLNGFKFKKVNKIVLNYRFFGFSSNINLALKDKLRIFKRYNLGYQFLINTFIEYLKGFILKFFKFKQLSKLTKFYLKYKYRKYNGK